MERIEEIASRIVTECEEKGKEVRYILILDEEPTTNGGAPIREILAEHDIATIDTSEYLGEIKIFYKVINGLRLDSGDDNEVAEMIGDAVNILYQIPTDSPLEPDAVFIFHRGRGEQVDMIVGQLTIPAISIDLGQF